MKTSRFAGAVMVAGTCVLFGCDQVARERDAANSNDAKKTEQSAASIDATTAPTGSTIMPAEPAAVGGVVVPGDVQNFTPNVAASPPAQAFALPPGNTEKYLPIDANPVKEVAEAPVSTFSVDVDSGSYANIRRFIMHGERPPKDAVRVEEMVNYFGYDYPGPDDAGVPFKATTRVTRTPWNPDTYLLEIGIKGYRPPSDRRPPANLVFLIDVSGSMDEPDKLPLLKSGMHLLVDQLRPDDKVSIVVYAGAAGVVLEPTSGKEKDKIDAALDQLEAGGSTAGGAGIAMAYALARQARIEGGINRIILATDGDFNVGVTDLDQLKAMIEDSRKSGIALTTLGVGEGNYNDALMEQLADVGNGNYGYVDSLKEAKRLLVDQLAGTIETIAKDVKVQIEFNPAVVAEYRLIGYENRALKRADFNNDKKDAGEIGAGHTVTALYEIALKGSKGLQVDPLRYGGETPKPAAATDANEFAFLRLRYKEPEGEVSKLIETPLATALLERSGPAGADLDFAAAVAAFGQKLRGGDYLKDYSYDQIAGLAKAARGSDQDGERAEFIDLVELAKSMGGS